MVFVLMIVFKKIKNFKPKKAAKINVTRGLKL